MPTYMHGDSISMIYVCESQHGHAEELIFLFRTLSKWNNLPVSIIHAGSLNAFNSRLTAQPQRAASAPFPSWSTWTLGTYHPDPDLHRGGSRI